MKVCFVTHDSPRELGGASSGLMRLLPYLRLAGIELELHVMATGGRPGVICAFCEQQRIPVRLMPILFHPPYAVRALLKFLEEAQPDIYIPNHIVPAFFAAGYAKRAGIPTIGVMRTDDSYYWGIVDEFINGNPDFRLSAIVTVSSFLESQIRPKAAPFGVMVRRIPSGISIPTTAAELPTSVFRLIYTGTLANIQKRISEVANALCIATQTIPNLEAWIVGDGVARPEVENIIRETGMGSRVKLLGWVHNARIYDLLTQCQSLVLLSDCEGMPVSVMEAMATGVVPICLDTRSGIREAIEHGVNGLIVKDRAADFFAAVRNLQSNPAKWQRMSMAARETARQRFSIEECARQWVDMLETLHKPRTTRADFNAPRLLRLPPPDSKFDIFGMTIPWKGRVADYIRATPPLYRMAKLTLAAGRRVMK
jgi:colanic acid/amylovoran biosynthesis glycosyltransferase